jgi:GDP-4-dehydro-6-deoxy-D-mannose reductase
LRETRNGARLEDGPILVTGAGGFAGRHLMNELNMGEGDVSADVDDRYPVPEGVRKVVWSLPNDPPPELDEVRHIVHLAAMSSVSRSLREVQKAYEINLIGTLSVLEYMVERSRNARLLFISSSDVYGSTEELMTEDTAIVPCNPYGATKAAAEIAVSQFTRNYDLDAVVTRSFPHFGPGQDSTFALPSYCRRIIKARREGSRAIVTGNLEPVRDYLYVSDVVRAYAGLLARARKGSTCNVCSGQGRSMRELIETLISLSGLHLGLEADSSLIRPVDVSRQVGSPARLHAVTGWEQEIPIETGLRTLLEWWEDRI